MKANLHYYNDKQEHFFYFHLTSCITKSHILLMFGINKKRRKEPKGILALNSKPGNLWEKTQNDSKKLMEEKVGSKENRMNCRPIQSLKHLFYCF